jgi:hypothetical protein
MRKRDAEKMWQKARERAGCAEMSMERFRELMNVICVTACSYEMDWNSGRYHDWSLMLMRFGQNPWRAPRTLAEVVAEGQRQYPELWAKRYAGWAPGAGGGVRRSSRRHAAACIPRRTVAALQSQTSNPCVGDCLIMLSCSSRELQQCPGAPACHRRRPTPATSAAPAPATIAAPPAPPAVVAALASPAAP